MYVGNLLDSAGRKTGHKGNGTSTMAPQNTALWLPKRGGTFQIGPAPYTTPGPDEVVVRTRAVAVNLVDGLPGWAYRLILPWLKFPTIVGGDVAGEVVEVGANVTRITPGQRVLGLAVGAEKSRNRAAEGAFQHYVVLMQHMVSPIPDSLPFEQAAVLPLTLSTAATGLFQRDHLGLALPTSNPTEQRQTVLIWGGSTSVGSNAIQLVKNAGYRVLTTASPRNFDYVRSLGAAAVADYHSPTVVDEIVAQIGDNPLAGTLAIGSGSVHAAVSIASQTTGSKKIAAAQPAFLTRIQSIGAHRKGVTTSSIWGGTLKDNEVGPGIFVEFLPTALTTGTYRAAPEATVVGIGLDLIPDALQQLRSGVSASKLVVTI